MSKAFGPMERDRARATVTPATAQARRAPWLLVALLVGGAVATFAMHAHAALYKWTDERGVVHYSDKLTADAVNRERFELNRQGQTIRKTEAARPVVRPIAKTPDDEQRLRLAERERVVAERRDRALIESYTSEGEIDLAKARAIGTIDGQVQSAEAFIAQMAKRRDELDAKKATFAPRPVPGSIEREIETIDAEVVRQNEFIAARRKEAATVAARYDSDKQRFRELRGLAPSGSLVTTDDGRYAASQPSPLTATSASAKH